MLDLASTDSSSPSATSTTTGLKDHYIRAGIPSIPSLIRFLVARQYAYLNPSSNDENEDEDEDNPPLPDLTPLSISDPHYPSPSSLSAGFNGRVNKVADTCYTWWVTGALSLLIGDGNSHSSTHQLIDRASSRRFLLSRTQHLIGGFAKHAGGPPDVYHAYLGLAALATMAPTSAAAAGESEDKGGDGREDGLGRFDPRLCLGLEATERVRKGREALLAKARARARANAAAKGEDGEEETVVDQEEKEAAERAREMLRKARTWTKSCKVGGGKNPVFEMDQFVLGMTAAPF